MRTVHELNQDELNELRYALYEQLCETSPDVLEDCDSPDDIPEDIVLNHYDGISFEDEDFFCNL
jgi:hypothetical protein